MSHRPLPSMQSLRRELRLAMLAFGLAAVGAAAETLYVGPTFLLSAEQRFDPAVQRWLAASELAAMPLENGQRFYIVPNTGSRIAEQAQIQYLERLIARRQAEAAATERPTPATGSKGEIR